MREKISCVDDIEITLEANPGTAEAEKFRLEKIAEAERKRIIIEAEAEAEAIAMKGLLTWKKYFVLS